MAVKKIRVNEARGNKIWSLDDLVDVKVSLNINAFTDCITDLVTQAINEFNISYEISDILSHG